MSARHKLASRTAIYGLGVIMALFVTGCGRLNDDRLVGCWWNEVRPDYDITTFCFRPDGDWSSSGPDESPMHGTYELSGDLLLWRWIDSRYGHDTTFRCIMHWSDEDHLRLAMKLDPRPGVEFNWERRPK